MTEKSITQDSTWKNHKVPRGKHHSKTATKTTVSLYLTKNVVQRARFHNLNLSRIAEQALLSILDYLESQNERKSSGFLSTGSFLKESVVDGAGFEPATSTMPTWRSYQADLPARFMESRVASRYLAGLYDAFGEAMVNRY